ncbi:hypothetical protein A3D80_03010 [Candidatus Roizmanbacteria bacterium RIFCSPHIGHO2_02_FULL_40_13b]|uniref:Uncharacterized protein n=1 Tax=Candidatus Roizmanbacteria bacterium RIFCSPHIGHO2_01_FULL_39_24 TaxID=1802032 RepID=A0A1F7GJ12_9BACT|nr:MAG: hypothetical protein A2799_02030 [Candidatus Roizmanbacteria bacterium RIFCSPHIGHO2_01_FULL_39_24]OGK27162.1 MAG: hypothetical protein A3D80_03010 [Candidatus Roizmanbacteria bacterium RIFCSPHIGHO2_02_FULL_40_13b]OGK49450.1 MAG: hypothetical protein A3A56_00145 [Candidatus Roizmanbacteria bacterium RIFCSPLOWO2_01_FULL_40_32]OGK57363.1 MAG: hypothetical protein A3H83_00810 [Candidatus Roizmanbacteria bacterium RIFCSPLOWO2_02_FULL_39_8]
MKKIIILYNVVVITVITVIGFVDTTSYPQLISSIIFFPLMVYFWRSIITATKYAPSKLPTEKVVTKKIQKADIETEKKPITLTRIDQHEEKKVDDNRRMFLRLIGSAGVSVFLLSIFTGKAEAAFFGSNPGPGTVGIKDSTGTLIDPSEKKPTDGYNISQIDDAIPSYYGYVNKDGAWYIIKEDATGAYRYVKGTSSFSTNWTDRAVLTYDYFNSIF